MPGTPAIQELPFSAYLAQPEGGTAPACSLAAEHPTPDFFTSPPWFRLLADTCLAPCEHAVVHRLAYAPGRVMDLPLRRAPLRVLGLRGQELHGLSNYYSNHYRPPGLGDDEDSSRAVACWAGALSEAGARPDRLVFRALDEGTLRVLELGLDAAPYRLERFADFGHWYLPCDSLAFDDYWNGRPGRLRNTVRRKLKALSRDRDLAFVRLDRPEQVAEAVEGYDAVHARAWQPAEPHADFLPALIGRGLRDGSVLLWLLKVDGMAIAAQIWTRAAGSASIFKLVYDRAWRDFSPGTLLTYAAMKSALESGAFRKIDLGRGDDAYKSDWMTERSQRWGLVGYSRKTLLGNALALRNLAPARLKSLVLATDS